MTRCDSNLNYRKQTENVPSCSKSHASQVSDAIYLHTQSPTQTYSSNESVNENIDSVHAKKKNDNVQKDLEMNKQDEVLSEHENSDDQNTVNLQRQETRNSYVNPHKKSSVKNAGFNERTIMAAISDLRSRIDKLHIMLIKIYTATCHPEETLENSIGIPTLPLISMEAFYEWEDFNSNEENKLTIIRLLVEHAREDLKGSVYCIMRKLLTNKVAVNFNFKGTNREGARIQKKKFLNTASYGLVIIALKRHSKERTDRGLHFVYSRDIADSHIANWLKDAKKRLENEELRLKKQQEHLENEDE